MDIYMPEFFVVQIDNGYGNENEGTILTHVAALNKYDAVTKLFMNFLEFWDLIAVFNHLKDYGDSYDPRELFSHQIFMQLPDLIKVTSIKKHVAYIYSILKNYVTEEDADDMVDKFNKSSDLTLLESYLDEIVAPMLLSYITPKQLLRSCITPLTSNAIMIISEEDTDIMGALSIMSSNLQFIKHLIIEQKGGNRKRKYPSLN